MATPSPAPRLLREAVTCTLAAWCLSGLFTAEAGPTRVANTSLNLPADLPSGSYSVENAFSGISNR